MSVLDEKWELSQQAQEFFVYEALGIVPKWIFDKCKYKDYLENTFYVKVANELNYEVYCAFLCAKAAYSDLNRTLEYKPEYKSDSKSKDKIKAKETTINNICIKIAQTIFTKENVVADSEELFKIFLNDDRTINDNNLKKYLTNNKKGKPQEIHFGQIQKWVNMTLKYLYLLGIITNTEKLHIPIDSYVIDALWEKNEIPLKLTGGKRDNNYNKPSDYVLAWSNWTEDQYSKDFIKSIEENCEPSPIDWEHKAWIEISEKRKGVK